MGDVGVPDPRLDKLADIAGSAEKVPTRLTFVDIAGLVRGASKGEGLGNQFLAHIREVDAVAYVLRCFEDADVAHVEGRVDPISDAEVVAHRLPVRQLRLIEAHRRDLIQMKSAIARDRQTVSGCRSPARPTFADTEAGRRPCSGRVRQEGPGLRSSR